MVECLLGLSGRGGTRKKGRKGGNQKKKETNKKIRVESFKGVDVRCGVTATEKKKKEREKAREG
jgi:hypothetical protein